MRPFAPAPWGSCPFEHLSLHIFATNEREMQEIYRMRLSGTVTYDGIYPSTLCPLRPDFSINEKSGT